MKYVRWFTIAVYLSLAACWLFNVLSLRDRVPFYVITAGSVAVAFLLPRNKMEECDDPTFGRWFIDRYGFVAVIFGTLLFLVSSGLIYREPVELNAVSNIAVGITASGFLSDFVPRSWFRRTNGRKARLKQAE
jgi:hypothetical protein